MTTIVQKWGNSLALRIPSAFAKDIHLHQGSEVEVAVVGGNMLIKPRKKPTLSQLLDGVTAQNIHAEQDYGGKAGLETW